MLGSLLASGEVLAATVDGELDDKVSVSAVLVLKSFDADVEVELQISVSIRRSCPKVASGGKGPLK